MTVEQRAALEADGGWLTPLRRMGTSEEVAAAALFLALLATQV